MTRLSPLPFLPLSPRPTQPFVSLSCYLFIYHLSPKPVLTVLVPYACIFHSYSVSSSFFSVRLLTQHLQLSLFFFLSHPPLFQTPLLSDALLLQPRSLASICVLSFTTLTWSYPPKPENITLFSTEICCTITEFPYNHHCRNMVHYNQQLSATSVGFQCPATPPLAFQTFGSPDFSNPCFATPSFHSLMTPSSPCLIISLGPVGFMDFFHGFASCNVKL